jgi:hypothetical protein
VEVIGLNRERAETHLRRIAEAELRRSSGRAQPSGDPDIERIRQVARTLRAVHAIDQAAVNALLADFELALTIRRPAELLAFARRSGGTVFKSAYRSTLTITHASQAIPGGTAPAAGTQSPPPPDSRVLPVGLMIPVTADDTSGEIYLMAYAHGAGGALFSVHARVHERPFAGTAGVPEHAHGMQPLNNLTAADEAGVSYALFFSGDGSDGEWTGQLRLHPDPPPGIRWLDLAVPGGAVTRVSLGSNPRPASTVFESTLSPGEHLLNRMAIQLLVQHPAGRLDDVVEALIAAGVLSPLSPVLGQLAALCDELGITPAPVSPAHASTAHASTAPACKLPEAWRSVLDYRVRIDDGIPSPGSGFAALAVAFPELDGTTLTLLGLHNHQDETFLHLHVRGVREPAYHYLAALPLLLWLRDDTGGWHTLGGSGTWSTHGGWHTHGDEMTARLPVVPPLLLDSTRLEIIATGLSAQARMTVALQWR